MDKHVRDRWLGILLVFGGMLALVVMGTFSGFPGWGTGWTNHHRWMGAMPAMWNQENPLPATDSVLEQGRFYYERFCVACHGVRGGGDGPAAKGLRPRPPALAITGRYPMIPDGYYFWRIKEGGRAFGTPMPSFDSLLTDPEIWSVVAYIRAGFPEVPAGASPVSTRKNLEEGGRP